MGLLPDPPFGAQLYSCISLEKCTTHQSTAAARPTIWCSAVLLHFAGEMHHPPEYCCCPTHHLVLSCTLAFSWRNAPPTRVLLLPDPPFGAQLYSCISLEKCTTQQILRAFLQFFQCCFRCNRIPWGPQ